MHGREKERWMYKARQISELRVFTYAMFGSMEINSGVIALLAWFICVRVKAPTRTGVRTKQADRACLKDGSRSTFKQHCFGCPARAHHEVEQVSQLCRIPTHGHFLSPVVTVAGSPLKRMTSPCFVAGGLNVA